MPGLIHLHYSFPRGWIGDVPCNDFDPVETQLLQTIRIPIDGCDPPSSLVGEDGGTPSDSGCGACDHDDLLRTHFSPPSASTGSTTNVQTLSPESPNSRRVVFVGLRSYLDPVSVYECASGLDDPTDIGQEDLLQGWCCRHRHVGGSE